VAYLENTPLFVEVAESLGIRSILHRGGASRPGLSPLRRSGCASSSEATGQETCSPRQSTDVGPKVAGPRPDLRLRERLVSEIEPTHELRLDSYPIVASQRGGRRGGCEARPRVRGRPPGGLGNV
jgi:hypothetical protein